MSRRFIVVGDPTDHDGKVISGSPTHTISGKPVARLGDKVDCPKKYPDGSPHGVNAIVEGEPNCLIDGVPAALEGHKSECGCRLLATVSAFYGGEGGTLDSKIMNVKKEKISSSTLKANRLNEDKESLKDPNVKAFLDAISEAEGGDYYFKYGAIKGKVNDKWRFTDDSTHPGAGFDGKTTAAGRYQINYATWEDMGGRVGLSNFSPETQDVIAVEILRSIKVIDSIKKGDLDTALSAASKRWSALPQGKNLPGRFKGQPYMSYENFSEIFNQRVDFYKKNNTRE
ncbi:PAAR domain-containing protein [Methylovorus sp. MP688]|uniref:PAAR domain-containing protein n=1 Tax=Methylovorus sp. (strain MP688) TaxID=887061 RepID=UPI0019309B10|nr:PAAR domain-containing protein [Methylovorus sp. MP688]